MDSEAVVLLEMKLPPANRLRVATRDKADRRWNEDWNGRLNYKCFRRSMRVAKAPFVTLVEHIIPKGTCSTS